MAKSLTSVTHRFCEWVITAHWHSYTVIEHRTERIAIEACKQLPPGQLVTNWDQFRLQAPCNIADEPDEAILAFYRDIYGMLSS